MTCPPKGPNHRQTYADWLHEMADRSERDRTPLLISPEAARYIAEMLVPTNIKDEK